MPSGENNSVTAQYNEWASEVRTPASSILAEYVVAACRAFRIRAVLASAMVSSISTKSNDGRTSSSSELMVQVRGCRSRAKRCYCSLIFCCEDANFFGQIFSRNSFCVFCFNAYQPLRQRDCLFGTSPAHDYARLYIARSSLSIGQVLRSFN